MLANTRDIRDAEEHLASLYAIRDYAALSRHHVKYLHVRVPRPAENAEAPEGDEE